MIKVEERFMARCLELARHAEGNTSPNPMVGAVIVHGGKIIGEGYHRKCGEGHAEVNAIASVSDKSLLRDSTIYVSLEPCAHYGKTPPCAKLIIEMGIPRVVVGCLDPFPAVSGRGIRMLREAGVEVVTGVLEEQAIRLNRPFMTMQRLGRPFVLLKWAQSADGYMDLDRQAPLNGPVVLSDAENMREVHKLRAEFAAIMVGTRTALLDNPSLTVRRWVGEPPVRVVIDRYLEIPENYHLLDGSVRTLVFTEKSHGDSPNREYVQADFGGSILPRVMLELAKRKLDSLIVEGGAGLLGHFIEESLWDEARVEVSPRLLGGGVKAPVLSGKAPIRLEGNRVFHYARDGYGVMRSEITFLK